jgi:hypothetical protein
MTRLRKAMEFLAGYIELLYVWIVCGAWEDFTKTHLSGETVASLFGGAFVALSVRNWYRLKRRLEAAQAIRKLPEPPAPRIFTDDSESLLAQLNNPKLLTEMQVVGYIDKWITLRGTVDFAGGFTLTLILESGQRVNIAFAQVQPLQSLRRGDSVTTVSQLARSFAEPWLSFKNGELVHTAQKATAVAKAS